MTWELPVTAGLANLSEQALLHILCFLPTSENSLTIGFCNNKDGERLLGSLLDNHASIEWSEHAVRISLGAQVAFQSVLSIVCNCMAGDKVFPCAFYDN